MDQEPLKPPLLLLHGFLGSGDDWQGLRPRLTPHVRLLTPDLPGHGRSPLTAEQNDFDGVCDALMTFLAHHRAERFHLLGYSLGGRIALHLAQRNPDRLLSLTLESCHPGLDSDELRQMRLASDGAWAEYLDAASPRDFLDAWYRQEVFAHLPEPARQALIAKRLPGLTANNRDVLRRFYLGTSLGHQENLRATIERLGCPVHFIVGETDSKFSALARDWRSQSCRLRLIEIAAAGHNCHLEQPVAFADALLGIIHGSH